MSADLRARIAEALTAWSCTVAGVPDTSKLMPQHREAVEQNSAARADAVLTVVQPELDAKDAEIEQLRTALDRDIAEAKEDLRKATAIQECTERDFARLRQDLAERDQLRAAAERVREIHQPVPCSNMRHDGGNGQHCGVCEYDDIGGNIWPCPTIRALDQAPAAEQDGGGE